MKIMICVGSTCHLCGSKKVVTRFQELVAEHDLQANIELAGILRRNGLKVALEVENRSMKAQMRSANNSGATFVVIRGDNELAENCAVIKNMTDGTEAKVSIEKLYDSLV